MARTDSTNPIKKVNGATIVVPSTYEISYQDVSEPNAGRDESGLMHKLKMGQKVKISLAWQYLTTAEGSAILNAFDNEYLSVEYLDLKVGGYTTKTFYVGDRTSPMYNAKKGLWEGISFNIIER